MKIPTPMIIITGPTAVGKSALALDLFQYLEGEFISADSQQVYRGCDIGTGKVPLVERRSVPHHLIDIVEPDDRFNVARFVATADAAIMDISSRGKRVIIGGGSVLYLQRLIFGIDKMPASIPELRDVYSNIIDQEGAAALHKRLAQIDPEAAAIVHPNHTSRVIRALEVVESSGKSILWWQRSSAAPIKRYNYKLFALSLPRASLRGRISRRIDAQMQAGWLHEVEFLRRRYGVGIPILHSLGYRDLLNYLERGGDLMNVVERIKLTTGQYAKRQETFIRSLPGVQTVDMEAGSTAARDFILQNICE